MGATTNQALTAAVVIAHEIGHILDGATQFYYEHTQSAAVDAHDCYTRAANADCINGGSRTRTKYTFVY